jgi:capsular exopolysaccharide synthesis family protein
MSKKHKETQTKAVGLITLTDPSSPVTEQYRTIRTNIQFASSVDRRLQTMVVTSSGPNEGKSITAANLAVVFAKSNQRVLLVDADMRKPVIYKTFQLNNNVGLSTLLSTTKDVKEAIQPTMIEHLSVLTSGPKPPNPSELLGSQRMNQVIQELKNAYDIIIFDMPPVVTVTDAQIMASKVDGTLLVVRENVTNKESLVKAKDLLTLVNAHVLGTVFNGTTKTTDQGYYNY